MGSLTLLNQEIENHIEYIIRKLIRKTMNMTLKSQQT